MMTEHHVKTVLDSVRHLVVAQEFGKVCEQLEHHASVAMTESRTADAASLYGMLASFRSMTKDDVAGLEALMRAEELEPENGRRVVATAAHLFERLKRTEEAKERLSTAINGGQLDAMGIHAAYALRGRIALAENRIEEASEDLNAALSAAREGDVDAMFWDRLLVEKLLPHKPASDSTRLYLHELIERASSEGDDDTKSEALKLLDVPQA